MLLTFTKSGSRAVVVLGGGLGPVLVRSVPVLVPGGGLGPVPEGGLGAVCSRNKHDY